MKSYFQTPLFFLITLLFTSALFTKNSYAVLRPKNFAVIINQVRGEECCSSGSLESTKAQLDTVSSLGLKGTFVLRYDALKDPRYVSLVKTYLSKYPDSISSGAMIEIIPSLALDAGVAYLGNENNWFHAQYAFTMGYEIDDRQKLLDTYMERYYLVFGSYPKISSSWMIDTTSANYLQEKYGVKAHQITREQWGTDSYTLYGGPFHYPYPASKNWVFMPDYEEKSPLLMLRQTVTDPLYNFGDTESGHTSQPNDYPRSGKDFAYFESLITNAFSQPDNQQGFVLLGLENSMSKAHQDEYSRQLVWLKSILEKYSVQTVRGDSQVLFDDFSKTKVSLYYGVNGSEKAWNVSTNKYRMRIIEKEGEIAISDIRLFSKSVKDPYIERVASYEAFWITPFMLDGSRWYKPKKAFSTAHAFPPPVNDFGSQPTRIELPGADIENVKVTGGQVALYDKSNKPLIIFKEGEVKFAVLPKYIPHTALDFPIDISIPSGSGQGYMNQLGRSMETVTSVKVNCDNSCTFNFPNDINNTKVSRLFEEYYPYYFPEPVFRKLSQKYSKVTVLNSFALAARNPVRIMLEPHDDLNFPILLDNDTQISPERESVEVVTLGDLRKSQYQYVDFYSQAPQSTDVKISMSQGPDKYDQIIRIFFAPNCKIDQKYCITHPLEAIWYAITKISDAWSGRR